jgi:hypothetical protein
MSRTGSVVVGLGLITLWLSVTMFHTPDWATTVLATVALIGSGAGLARVGTMRPGATLTGAMALGMFVLRFAGAAERGRHWKLVWWDLAIGCALLLVAVAPLRDEEPVGRARHA